MNQEAVRKQGRRRQMREQGFTDGTLGRPARWLDADYQEAWRRGQAVRLAANNDQKETPE